MRNLIKYFHKINNFFSKQIFIENNLKKILIKNKLTIADIGALGINENNKFNSLISKDYTKIFKFDDLIDKKSLIDQNYDTILWSEEKNMNFFIRANKVSSSLFETNDDILKEFKNYKDHNVIEKKIVKTKALSSINELVDIDLLKIDAEGAELEILKGLNEKIDNVLTIELEMQFIERYLGSPLFEKIHEFLKDNNFELYLINQESWIKNEKKTNSQSNHKIIWGDFVYFKKISKINKIIKFRENYLPEKFIILLVFYKFYDEAYSALHYFKKNNLINISQKEYLEMFVKKNIQSNFTIIVNLFFKLIFSILVLILCSFTFKYKRQGLSYFKKTFKNFFYAVGDLTKLTNKDNNTIRDDKI